MSDVSDERIRAYYKTIRNSNSGSGPYDGTNSIFMTLAKTFKRPVAEIKRIVGYKQDHRLCTCGAMCDGVTCDCDKRGGNRKLHRFDGGQCKMELPFDPEVWIARLAIMLSKSRVPPSTVYMDGSHNPNPAELKQARAFINAILEASIVVTEPRSGEIAEHG